MAEVKRDDPLAPGTVLVPTNLAGVLARRGLTHGTFGRPLAAGLAVLAVDRLAERISAPSLAAAARRLPTDAVFLLMPCWR